MDWLPTASRLSGSFARCLRGLLGVRARNSPISTGHSCPLAPPLLRRLSHRVRRGGSEPLRRNLAGLHLVGAAQGLGCFRLCSPKACEMPPRDAFILAAVAKLGQRGVDVIQDRARVRMRLGDHDMKTRERKGLFERLNSVSHAERVHARSPDKLSLDHAVYTAVIEQAKTLVDRRWTNERYLSVLQPVAAALIEFVGCTDGRSSQCRAGYLLGAQCLDARVITHEHVGRDLGQSIRKIELLAS